MARGDVGGRDVVGHASGRLGGFVVGLSAGVDVVGQSGSSWLTLYERDVFRQDSFLVALTVTNYLIWRGAHVTFVLQKMRS